MSVHSSRSSSPLPATPSRSQTRFAGNSAGDDASSSFGSFEGHKISTQGVCSPQFQLRVDETDLRTALEDLDINEMEGHDFTDYQSLDTANDPIASVPLTYTTRAAIPEPVPYYEDYYEDSEDLPNGTEEEDAEEEGKLVLDDYTNQLSASLSFDAIFTDADLFSLSQAYYYAPVLIPGPIPQSEDEDQGPEVTIDADLSGESGYTLDIIRQESGMEEPQEKGLPALHLSLPGLGRVGDGPRAFGEEEALPLAPGVPLPQHIGITEYAASRLIHERHHRLN